MQHLDPDRLVLLALDEAATDDAESGHIAGCAACQTEVDALRQVAVIGAETQEVRELPAPPERIWQRIAAEVSAGAGAFGAASGGADASGAAGEAGGASGPGRPVFAGTARGARSTARRRWSAWARPAMVAAAAAAAGVLGTLAVTGLMDTTTEQRPTEPAVTAQVELNRFADAPPGVAGDARVLAAADQEKLHLHVTGLPLTTGYYEVWLINPDTMQMISVGTLGREPDALLPLPDTVNLNAYRTVDVSQEQYDNKPAHSGVSLLRGTLTG